MTEIRDWVERVVGGVPGPKTILELGAYDGKDTQWMAAMPGATVHAFEPDPRSPRPLRLPPNVRWHEIAIAGRDGPCTFHLSSHADGRRYTKSSSIRKPKRHTRRHPHILFDQRCTVGAITLDTFTATRGLDSVDLIWADVQGAEGDMIAGGHKTFAKTRYLYTEYSDSELYDGQPTLSDILAMLPGWLLVKRWNDDVLLANGRRMDNRVAPVPAGLETAVA